MYFPVALVFLALPFLTQAYPSEATVKTGLSIPISKRSTLRNADGVVNITMLGARQHHTIEFVSIVLFMEEADHFNVCLRKIKRGLDAFERNTGRAHPYTLEMRQSNNERRGMLWHSRQGPTGSVPLTDDWYWSGPITVGSPGRTFSGEHPFRLAEPSKLIT